MCKKSTQTTPIIQLNYILQTYNIYQSTCTTQKPTTGGMLLKFYQHPASFASTVKLILELIDEIELVLRAG